MKKFIKTIPFALLVLPLVAGCGKNGPSLSKKGSVASEKVFGDAYDAARKEVFWEKEDYKIAGAAFTQTTETKTETVVKRGNKKLSSTNETTKAKTKLEIDGVNHIAKSEVKSKSKTINKAIEIKKDKHIEKSIAKGSSEAQSLYSGKANTLVYFDHVRKEYNLQTEYADASKLDAGFQEYVKGAIESFFALSPKYVNDKGTMTYYVNGNILSYEFTSNQTEGSSENGGYANVTVSIVEKGQVNYNAGKYELVHFAKKVTKTEYVKNDGDFAIGDVETETIINEEHAKGKEKKVNLKYTKIAKYTDLTASSQSSEN